MKKNKIESYIDDPKVEYNMVFAIDKIKNTFAGSLVSNLKIIKSKEMVDLMQVDTNPRGIQVKKGLTVEEAYRQLKNINREQLIEYSKKKDAPSDLLTGDYKNRINNGNDVVYLTIHEFAHIVDRNYRSREGESLSGEFKKQLDLMANGNYIKAMGCRELGVYILESSQDLFAEAFADCIINKENATEAGKLIPKFLKEQGVI